MICINCGDSFVCHIEVSEGEGVCELCFAQMVDNVHKLSNTLIYLKKESKTLKGRQLIRTKRKVKEILLYL